MYYRSFIYTTTGVLFILQEFYLYYRSFVYTTGVLFILHVQEIKKLKEEKQAFQDRLKLMTIQVLVSNILIWYFIVYNVAQFKCKSCQVM